MCPQAILNGMTRNGRYLTRLSLQGNDGNWWAALERASRSDRVNRQGGRRRGLCKQCCKLTGVDCR